MTRIGLLSDTHGLLDRRIFEHFKDVDEIWHAGDIGSAEVLQALREFKPTRAVYGNMDSGDVRYSLPEFYRFRVEEVNVLMTHIGGYPGKYNPWLIPWFRKSLEAKQQMLNDQISNLKCQISNLKSQISNDNIDLFVCGHSHILKVQYDNTYKFLTMNPGAAGKQGWQPCQTLLRFTIDGAKIDNLEVIELERK
jgi:putative phosphoesterase